MNDEANTIKQKKQWIRLVNTASCIAVVFLHINECFWEFSNDRYWITANIIECVFYFAVPCFFMISGATLMDYRERYSLGTFFKKRINKTVIPFIFWSFIALVYCIILGSITISEINAQYIWNGLVNTQFLKAYWFFPVLFGLYLSIPLFAAVRTDLRKEIFSYAAIASFILGGVIPLLCNTVFKGYAWNLSINAASGFLIYILVGYLIAEYDMGSHCRRMIYTFAALGFIIHLAGTYYLSTQAQAVIATFKGYTNAPSIMYSVGAFVWAKYNGNKLMCNGFVHQLVSMVEPYTLGIYLLHWFIYTSLVRAFDINTYSIIYRFGSPFLVIPVAIAITWAIRRIPLLRHTMPK